MSQTDLAPRINGRAWLSFDASLSTLYPSRIEDVNDTHIKIAGPLTHNGRSSIAVVGAPQDKKCILLWNHEAEEYGQQECLVTEIESRPFEMWKLSPAGQASIVQRRAFTRVPEDMQAQLHFSDRSVDVQLKDISEGGLSCGLRSFEVGIEHYPVYADLIIGGQQVLIPSQLVRLGDSVDEYMEIGIQFTQIANIHSDLIRNYVLGQIDSEVGSVPNER